MTRPLAPSLAKPSRCRPLASDRTLLHHKQRVSTPCAIDSSDPRWHATAIHPPTNDPVPGTYRVVEITEAGLLVTYVEER